MLIKYDSNNSGGSWWLSDEDWKKLEGAGWKVNWHKDEKESSIVKMNDSDGRWLGALASSAEKDFPSVSEAIKEFEEITGQDASDEGCNCCGAPHTFEWDDSDGNWQYVSGSECLNYIYDNPPQNLRDACEKLSKE